MSSSDNLVQINGFWVDLTTVESTLIIALSSCSLISVKLVPSSTRLALFFTALSKADELAFLKAAREILLTCPSFPEPLAAMISFAKQLTEMPVDEDGDIDVSALRSIAEERWEARRASRRSRPVLETENFGPAPPSLLSPPSVRQPGTARITSMPAMPISAFHSSTFPPVPEVPTIAIYSPESTPTLPVDAFSARFGTTPTYPPPVRPSSIMGISLRSKIALEIASHVTTLLSLPASSSVPTYLPLKLAGLNSVATAQLYFWLQERYEYDEDIARLFEDDVSAEVIASQIAGDSASPAQARFSSVSTATTETVNSSYSEADFQPTRKEFDDIDLETDISKTADNVQKKPEVYTVDPNPLSYVFVSWMTGLMWRGSKKPLTKDDLYNLNPKDSSAHIDGWVSQFWDEYDAFCKRPGKDLPRLWGSMMKYARKFFIASALLWFMSILLGLFGPILIQQLIVAASAPARPKDPQGAKAFDDAIKKITGGVPLFTPTLWVLALSLFGSKALQTILGRTSENMIKNTALNVKTALIGAVYKKSLRLGPQGIGRFEKGYILNLVNVDAEAVSKAIELGNLTWSIPIQLGVTVYLLYRVLTVSVWAGVGVLFGALLVLILVVPLFFRTSAPMFARFGDKRMKMIKEIMEGMTLIKVRGWEAIFLQRLEVIRQTQLGYLKTFNTGVTVFVIVGQLANTLVPMAALSLFGKKGEVTAARVFPAISFFSMLVEPLIALPQLLSACAVAAASWGRIYTFLMASEAAPVSSDVHPVNTDPIRISNGSFEWAKKDDAPAPAADENAEKPKAFIHDINMSIKKGSLTAIVGPVGCGKSSLFSAILGEMNCVSGKVVANGSIAYCPQQPWIESSTVQENITFGKPMDIQRLKRAVGAASFAADLERLPNGISSEIVERGANLSGGQKARLSLARAIYADADIYLLDDPLAALDPRVGRTVFQECFLNTLHGKTRVLITQALGFLPQVDHVIVLSNGTIAEQGSYAQLCRRNGHLRKMVDAVEKRTEKADKKSNNQEATRTKRAAKAEDAPSGNIVADEDVTTGAIRGSTWWSYIKAAGGWKIILALVLSVVSQQAGTVMMNQWLTWWTTNKFQEKIEFWFGIYDGIGIATAFLMVVVNTFILFGVLAASRTFHNRAFSGVIGAPMGWFHANPAGRVINRFSKDMESIDQRLMPQIFQAIAGLGSLISAVAILGRSSPAILGVLAPVFIVNWFLLRFYRATLRELRRLESRMRSPLQSKVNETLDGIPTIAAFKREGDFAGSAAHLIDDSNKPVYLRNTAEVWLTLYMELLSALVVLAIAMLGKTTQIMNTSQFGSALAYASALTYIMNLLVKAAATIESEMSSVERLQEYSDKLPKDAAPHLPTDPVEGSWPSRGEIIFKGVEAAYPSRPEKPVLKGVNIRIQPGTTVFIVGRTGSGKSTLLSVLLRLLELGKGNVLVDGEDISKLGVHTLRRGMELIPQDPFIFSGTIRTALDFEGRYDDTSLWHALELVGLKDFVAHQENKLDTIVADNGSNYSVGQRQLICLAGAILRSPKILLLDEATASVDAGSDAFLQKTMRVNCPGATILSVMHRLSDQVLKECDYVLVMDEGTPAEFDSPKALMTDPNSLFSRIMEATRQT